ncbi:MAG TPA: type IX secretion system sortase PorU, partial [Perlabentimonas sp.]|nr:type IX secretion system sortase PorU [Perlabentimonas sp.]
AISLFFVVFQSGVAQSYKRTIEWPSDSLSKSNYKDFDDQPFGAFLWFEDGVSYPNLTTMLPYYSETIPVSNDVANSADIEVVSKTFEPFSNADKNALRKILREEIEKQDLIVDVLCARGKYFLQYSIPAVGINPANGQVEKLKTFSIEIKRSTYPISQVKSDDKSTYQSVLSSGSWQMVSVAKTGVHKVSYAELLDMGFSNVGDVTIWGQDGKQLSFWNKDVSLDDLIQIPIYVDKGADGTFNQGDNIYFFAQGPVTWQYDDDEQFFSHHIHDFASEIRYFITTSMAEKKRVSTLPEVTLPVTSWSTSFDDLLFFERNDTNLIKSGRQWFGEAFDVYTTREYATGLINPVPNGTARVKVNVAARSSVGSSFSLKANDISVGSISIPSVNLGNPNGHFAAQASKLFSFSHANNELKLELTYNKPTAAAKGWLDYIAVNARQKLTMTDAQLLFRDLNSVDENAVTQFSVDNAKDNLKIWDVTDFFAPQVVPYSQSGSVINFRAQTDLLKQFVAFYPSKAMGVSFLGEVPNQNIHGQPQPEMVIVAHPNFMSHAQELSDIHKEHSGLKVLVVSTEQVYNEFSSGNPDVAAIRNMMRMFYRRSTTSADMPRYLLLFGDGSYDNRESRNTSLVPTFQSRNSLHAIGSFVSDDFFGLLDDDEGEATGLLDIGIGRIPCSNTEQANIAISKIRQYLSSSSVGAWNTQLCFIGDDGDGNMHMRDADSHAQFVESTYPHYNIDKIYFDSFPLESGSQGDQYPAVTTAINARANQGTLIMNYVGHANAEWLGHEQVLKISDIQSWRNFDKLMLFITATCEYSRFDDLTKTSAGEHALFAPRGGSIALVSTSRVVFAPANKTLNRNFIEQVFAERTETLPSDVGKHYRLGDALRLAKVVTGGEINKRNFLLLGDPALQLHYPVGQMGITTINSIPVDENIDTLKALSRVDIKGGIILPKRNESFGSEMEFTLFDKAKTQTTLSNRGNEPFVYTSRPNVIYRGRSTLSDGAFSGRFIVPKDIMYSYGTGRFSLFAKGVSESYAGVFEDFLVGGISDNAGSDTEGPDIKIFMNTESFVSGGVTDASPKLVVHLTDSSGVNTTGVGIGHDLTATLIGQEETTIVLNDYYINELDSYQRGTAEYQLYNLSPGPYKLRVKAWDVYNNSSEAEIEFVVKSDEKFALSHVLNYPNPFTSTTGFYFEHNQPYEDFDILIQIFSPSGKLVKTLEHYVVGQGDYRVGPITWDGLDDFGDRVGRGVYFYRLKVK